MTRRERDKMREYAKEKVRKGKKKESSFLLCRITISCVFEYLLKQLINSCIAFQLSCFSLPFFTCCNTENPYNLGSTYDKKMFILLVFKVEIFIRQLSHFLEIDLSINGLTRVVWT